MSDNKLSVALDDVATATPSVLQTIRNTTLVQKEVEGEGQVLFVRIPTNTGKGSGAQMVRVDEFEDFVATLRAAADSGFEQAEIEEGYKTAAQMTEDTLALSASVEDGPIDTVSFRVRGGKGAKPARIPLDEAVQVVEYLEGRIPKLNAVLAKIAAQEVEAPEAPEDDDDNDGEGDGE